MNILIIGKNSYIGNHLEKYLRQLDTFCVSMVSAKEKEYVKIDYSKYDAVIMLSSIVHKKHIPEEIYREINYELPCHIFDMCKSARVNQFVYFSTMAVYGNDVERIDESTKENPATYYAKYKLLAEEYLSSHKDDTIHVAIVRPPMVYGDGCPGNYTTLEKYAKYLLLFPEIENKRSAVHVERLCEYVGDLIVLNREGIFFPQNNEYLCTYKTITTIRKLMGKSTILFTFLNPMIKYLEKRVSIVKKVFGNLYYDRDKLK